MSGVLQWLAAGSWQLPAFAAAMPFRVPPAWVLSPLFSQARAEQARSLSQVEAGSEAPTATVEELLATELVQNDKLEVGHLENGLRYVILPNRAPPNRFEAHLEVHAGACAS